MPLKKLRLVLSAACAVGLFAHGAVAQSAQSKATTVDGVRIFYREAGSASAPTIVLLHGLPSSSFMYRNLIVELAPKFHVIAPDNPGMGYSDAIPTQGASLTYDREAAVLSSFLHRVAGPHFILYMQDIGGAIGMRIVTAHPDWVSGLVFQNTPISLDGWNAGVLKNNQAPLTDEKRTAMAKVVSIDTDIFLHKQGAAAPDALNPDDWTIDVQALSTPAKHDAMTDLLLDIPANLALYPTWQAYLKKETPPTLVVWGRNDPIFDPAGAAAIKTANPKAEVHLYNAGHFALDEQATDIAAKIAGTFSR